MIAEKVEMKGTVNLWCYENGKLLWHEEFANLIVNGGRTAMAHLVGNDVSGRPVTKIGVGTSATGASTADTALTGATIIAIGAVNYPSATSVIWNFTFGTTVANGTTIQELGLICTDNTLFSRVTRPPIVKTSSISIIGTWRIDF